MMNKIIVTVAVPIIEEEYDIYIPVSKTIKVTKELLIKTINELSDGYYPIIDNNSKVAKTMLLSSNGDILPTNNTIKECGLKNGDKIIMI